VRSLAGGARLLVVRVRRWPPERRPRPGAHVPADFLHDGGELRDALRLLHEVADDDVAAARLGRAADDRDPRAVLHRALELLVERSLRVVDRDGKPGLAERGRELETRRGVV